MQDDLEAQKKRALELVLDAWDRALADGVAPEMLASVAIYAALVDMIDRHGVEPVAELCRTLPDRVLRGEFTLKDEAESS